MPRPRPAEPRLALRRGTWCVVWYDGGQRRRVSAGTANPALARQFLEDFRAEADRRPLASTFAAALDRYVAGRAGKVMAHARLAQAATALKRALGELRVDQITQTAWDRYATERTTRPGRRVNAATHQPRAVSPGTLRREFNVLRATLRRAWRDGFLSRPPSLEPPADSAPRDRFLTRAEARALLAACREPHVRVFLALAFGTGARKGAILALTWDRVDFRTGMIDFQEPGRPLTAKRRAVAPMNTQLRATLQEARQAARSGHVVEYAGQPVPHGLRWSWRRLCERAGLAWRPTPHHIKHSVASWLAEDGVPVDQVADLTNTDPRTLRRIYRKFDPAYLRPVAEALAL
ncbi:MAG: tyrosine-type recombinase/integrase [Xanthomonadaceae bacterium]|nr:tyrosine-type recombinase/integrase [Xanthomonadaceae bacterium]